MPIFQMQVQVQQLFFEQQQIVQQYHSQQRQALLQQTGVSLANNGTFVKIRS